MSERQAAYTPGAGRIPPDLFEAVMARYRAESNPRLLELLDNVRRALDELAAYLVVKCEEAGVEVPGEWREYRDGWAGGGLAQRRVGRCEDQSALFPD